MTKKFNQIVFIGRFQPVHNAHVAILRRARELADTVIVVIGSANQPRTVKNPFTVSEREHLIKQAWWERVAAVADGLQIVSVEDNVYNDQAWAISVQKAVAPFITDNVAIIGHSKDESSFYLKMFPQWEHVEQELVEPLHAARIREIYFDDTNSINFIDGVVPPGTLSFLRTFLRTDEYKHIVEERRFIERYKKQFESLAYPPVFVTADAVVIQSGHVLMVTRRSEPGKGQLAFPGGFLNAKSDKSMEDCMIRELLEETKIKVPVPALRGNIKDSRVFDAIERSSRGRTVTHAFKIVLRDEEELPKVKGSDDALHARWIPIGDVKRDECFEDHYDILQWAVGN
jgi:bifunctional NMN adenylyltransferase/nudix hydrolase